MKTHRVRVSHKKANVLEKIRDDFAASVKKLENENLTKSECEQLMKDIDEVMTIEEEPSTVEETMMPENFEELFEAFQLEANKSKTLMEDILSVISGGRVPEEDAIRDFDSSIDLLRSKYEGLHQFAEKLLSEEELPEDGSPAAEYYDAIKNSKALKYKDRIEDIKNTLMEFLSVKSLISAYEKALQPYQEQAKDLLSKISDSIQDDELDSISDAMAGPGMFMEIMKSPDPDSEETLDMVDQAAEYFTGRALSGLTAQKYYIDENAYNELQNNEPALEEDMDPTKAELTEQATEEEDEINNDESIKENEEENVSELDDNTADEKDNNQDNDAAEVVKEDSELVKELKANGAWLNKGENVGFLTCETKDAETKKISASIFSNEMRQGASEKAEKKILNRVCSLTVVSAEYLINVEKMPDNVVEINLDYLCRKGYLRRFVIAPYGDYYTPSPRLIKAASYKEGSKYIDIRKVNESDWHDADEGKANESLNRVAFLKVFTKLRSHAFDAGVLSSNLTTAMRNAAFVNAVVPADDIENGDLGIGAFWDENNTSEDVEDLVRVIGDVFNGDNDYARVVYASFDLDRARALAKTLIEHNENLREKKAFLYSLTGDIYYSYPDSIEVDDLWNIKGDLADEDVVKEEDERIDAPSEVGQSADTVAAEAPPITEDERNTKDSPQLELESSIELDQSKDGNSIKDNVYSLINAQKLYAAVAYTKACANRNSAYTMLYDQLAYALNDPMRHCIYSTESEFNLITKDSSFEDALVISMSMRMFFSNQMRYDYNIKSFYSGIKDYKVLTDMPSLSKVVYSLMEFKENQKKGMDAVADYRVKSKAERDRQIAAVKNDAQSYYDNIILSKKKESTNHKRFLETKKRIFNVDNDIAQYLKAIIDSSYDLQPLAVSFLQEKFFKEDSMISENTIDGDMLWDYIVKFWDDASEVMAIRKREDLKSHLRSNITNLTLKAIQMIAKWCNLVEEVNNSTEDDAAVEYKRIRKPLLDNLETAIGELNDGINSDLYSLEDKAGLRVLLQTSEEIKSCVDGTMSELSNYYFYVPFLLTDDVTLDDNYLPDLDVKLSSLAALQPEKRILNHVKKLYNSSVTYEARLKDILEDEGDDYGSAKLIVDYLKQISPSDDLKGFEEAITSGESYVKDTAKLRRDNFIGELELAQSYGQIDNSEEDKKDRILQIVDRWYEWAKETANYGFFMKIMDSYLSDIRESSKSREKDLRTQLEDFKAADVPGVSADSKKKRIAKIEEMFKEQNYTVAEDLLARVDIPEDGIEEIQDEDFLQEFLENYDDYYRPVSMPKANFASLVNSRARNKETRGAKKMVDNWLPGGGILGKEKLTALLSCFGFKVDSNSVSKEESIGKFENYYVKTLSEINGHQGNYTHPIAAFGSGAASEGFRVVCVNGVYDATGLIDIMKLIGNARNTLVLYDNALKRSERRTLARKTKNSLGDKLFAVIDRTVMMFLFKNYDENKINRMLISLITPFGYYQPYVWESANVMPPEIFMGRKHELERIKSSTGVNIVYGGRQLGKSALLKKAKDDIDWNENGDRAIYVEIKGLDYKAAAKKVGHELYDQFILKKEIETEDWDELARAVKNRLRSDEEPIHYLLLLLDEADTFIESCEEVNYKPFDALKDIQSIGSGKFKFVIAGLRNIVRFKREAALGNNSVLTHLEPMTVKPFNTSEARELLEVPLRYLGLRFPKDKESLVTLILATTNYFPGLIQMYCAKLIEAMRNKDYAGYDEVDSPIYEVSEEHIKKVLADPDFMQQIREKYFITLKLDEDNYYYIIALIMAYLYHNNGYSFGYTVQDVIDVGKEYSIDKISKLGTDRLTAFMEELKELNVLRSTDETHYLFTRFTFFQMMGSSPEVDEKLVEYMGE